MLTHCVFFWLKEGVSASDKAAFEEGVRSLTAIPGVVHGTAGAPAASDRPVVDRSYSYALMVVFHDMAGHDVYQTHPIHRAFLSKCSPLWTKVVVYDFEAA
ncbi:MAG TPA: Dabb family protein [Polyangiaceae bacterium]|nr:Dabb family protein [Polyangiaceae bacterium]